MKKLRKALLSCDDCWEEKSRGNGSHTMFFRKVGGSTFSYPIPKGKDVMKCYVKGVRKKLKLTESDGTTDKDFYSNT